MDRLELVGAIGVGALVIILVSGVWSAQYLAAIVVLAGARPVFKAIKRLGIATGYREAANLLDLNQDHQPSDEADQQ